MAARTILQFVPESAHFPTTNFPQLMTVNARPVLAFDAATDETAYFTFVAPTFINTTMTLIIHGIAASATSGAVRAQSAVEAVTPADATDLDAGTSFATQDSAGATVGAVAGYDFTISITISNTDSIAAGDYVRLAINRDADGTSGTDDAAGDWYMLAAELQDNGA